MTLRRILVALDDSPRAPAVFETAVDLARRTGATIVLFRALAIPPEFPPAAATLRADALPRYLEREATASLQLFTEQASDVPCEILIRESLRAARAILDAAAEQRADLIVIGSHGYDPIDRLLGTTAAKVVNLAACNVLVVHRAPTSAGAA